MHLQRSWQYYLLSLILIYFFLVSKNSDWLGGPQLHTLLEEASTLLALMIGSVALIRFYSKRSNFFLFLGAGFVGTAWLEGYHTFITSSFADITTFESDSISLSPWSWLSSRIFVATLLLLSLMDRNSTTASTTPRIANDISVYAVVTALTIGTFIFFNQAHLPAIYFPSWFFSRPAELIVGFIFAICLWIHLKNKKWKTNFLDHFLSLALISGFFVQILYMPMSTQLYDSLFFSGHLLKIISYLFVLIALLGDTYRLYRKADKSAENLFLINSELQSQILERQQAKLSLQESEARLRAILDNVLDGIVTIDEGGTITSFNRSAERIFGYTQFEILGKHANILVPSYDFLANINFDVKKTIGKFRETKGLRSDGCSLPIDFALTEMWIERKRYFIGILRDITDRKEAEYALLQLMSLQQAILNGANYSIISTNTLGTIEIINQTAQRWLGYSEDEMVGKQTPLIFHQASELEHHAIVMSEKLNESVSPNYDALIALARQGVVDEQEWNYIRKDGTTLAVLLSVTPLKNTNNEITGFLHIAGDITERQKVDRMKREFISTVSHELRTPLTSIKGSLGLIKGGIAGELVGQCKSLIDIAYQNSERLVRLINDILDIDKIESGKMNFVYTPIDITSLVEYAISANNAYAEQYNVEYRLVQSAPDTMVNANSDRLLQVLTNLLSNAAKFSPPHSQIEISISEQNNWVTVSVKDYGNGVPEHFRSKIFEKFSQADSSDTRQKGGTGLGLSISRAIIMKHGGQLNFESIEGLGAVFYFNLPTWQKVELLPENHEVVHEARRILICEDDNDTSNVLRIILNDGGYDVDVAYNAEEAYVLLHRFKYSAMTLDIRLPGQDGISLIQNLRADATTKNLPIIVVSGLDKPKNIDAATENRQIADWLEKPINPVTLLETIKKAVRDSSDLLRVLHIEDDNDICQIVKSILQNRAIVFSAPTLARGRDILASQDIDLILLDLSLPDGCGLDIFTDVRLKEKKIPFIVFSANEPSTNSLGPVLIKSQTTNELLLQTINDLTRTFV